MHGFLVALLLSFVDRYLNDAVLTSDVTGRWMWLQVVYEEWVSNSILISAKASRDRRKPRVWQ